MTKTAQYHFVEGFIKQAALHGFTRAEAIQVLEKQAGLGNMIGGLGKAIGGMGKSMGAMKPASGAMGAMGGFKPQANPAAALQSAQIRVNPPAPAAGVGMGGQMAAAPIKPTLATHPAGQRMAQTLGVPPEELAAHLSRNGNNEQTMNQMLQAYGQNGGGSADEHNILRLLMQQHAGGQGGAGM